jgi:hypothetical protein
MVPWLALWLLEVDFGPWAGFSEHPRCVPAQLAPPYHSGPEDVDKGWQELASCGLLCGRIKYQRTRRAEQGRMQLLENIRLPGCVGLHSPW